MKFLRLKLWVIIFCFNSILLLKAYHFDVLDENYPKNKIKVVKKIVHKTRSIVVFITDKDGKLYLIKQCQTKEPQEQFYAVKEMFAGHLSETMKIPAHRVGLLPAGFKLNGKPDNDRPATIHTIVRGEPVKHAPPPYNVNLQQVVSSKVAEKNWGLSPEILRNMAVHTTLPLMAALDTYMSNGGRHGNNFFYDKKSNNYYGIDQEHSFQKPLGRLACQCIEKLLVTGAKFTSSEQRAIVCYRGMLRQLMKKFPLHILHILLNRFTKEANISRCFGNDLRLMNRTVRSYEASIADNYRHIKRLIELLDYLIHTFPKQEKPKIHYQECTVHDDRPIKEIIKIYEKVYARKRKKKFEYRKVKSHLVSFAKFFKKACTL